MEPLNIQMLGEFTLSCGENQISDKENRSHKVWLLLAYLVYHRNRTVPQAELLKLLWGDAPTGNNPTGALKTTFHRVRTTLDRLWPSAGHQLILCRDGNYIWNSEIPVTLDVEGFDRLARMESDDKQAQLQFLMQALKLYGGDFLCRLSSEPWVIPISTYFHNLYIQTLLEAIPMLMEDGRQAEVIELCRTATSLDPYHETVHCYLMRALMELGEQKEAIKVYRELSDRLYSNFGVLPSDETRALYHEASRTVNDHAMSMGDVLEQLEESDSPSGAMICQYDFFRVLCRSVARSMSRTGIATHIAMLSVTNKDGGELSARSLPRCMDNLEEQIRINLRKGDSATRCSASQFVLLLPQANYENSEMVCNRIIRSFIRQYPHTPAAIHYSIQPLEPNI